MTVVCYDRDSVGYRTDLSRLGSWVPHYRRTEIIMHHSVVIDNDATRNVWETTDEVLAKSRQMQTIRPDLGLDVPYSWLVYCMADGSLIVVEGRGFDRRGAHTAGHNTTGIGMGWMGDFRGDLPPNWPDQIEHLAAWMQGALRTYMNIASVHGHQDFKAGTECPGLVYEELDLFAQTFGLDNGGGNPMASISVKEWQSILNVAGVTDANGRPLVEDGVYGAKTRSALVKMARGGTSTGSPHNHNDLYAAKRHSHVATTTVV